jgi:Signal transduction histidine kinase regulating C4-dicarboxylate transport system
MTTNPEQVIQRMGRRYLGVLIAVAGLLILDQAVLQPLLIRLSFSAPMINLAGRQRMLSQRLTKSALVLASTSEPALETIQELKTSLQEWIRVHEGLQLGDAELDLLKSDSREIRAAFARLTPHFEPMRDLLESLTSGARDPADVINQLLKHEPEYLRMMDEIVALCESDAKTRIQQLRLLGGTVTGFALLLLMGLAVLVLRPAIQLIRRQVQQLSANENELRQARDELELRVNERTCELLSANAALAREVEERQLAELRSRQLQSDLAHMGRVTSLGQLATGLAHELNQPLGAISNFSETLQLIATQTLPHQSDLVVLSQRIKDSALRAGRIVSQMRNFVRPQAGERERESLSQLIQEVVDFCEPEIRAHQVRLSLNLPKDDPQLVVINSIQIQQVLVNLVQNALQAMSNQEPTTRVLSIDSTRDHGQVMVVVEDQGPGFPPECSLSQFKPFHSTKPGGLGIGLSISETLITSHGGTLWAKNLAPRGARVCFTLPSAESVPNDLSSSSNCLCR